MALGEAVQPQDLLGGGAAAPSLLGGIGSSSM